MQVNEATGLGSVSRIEAKKYPDLIMTNSSDNFIMGPLTTTNRDLGL